MTVIADTISTNTYYFQSNMGDNFDPNASDRNDIVSMPFLEGRDTTNDINIGGFKVVAGGAKDEAGGNTDQGWSGVKVPVAGIYMCSFNLRVTTTVAQSSDRFRIGTMFTMTNDFNASAGGTFNFNTLPTPIKSAMCYIRNASSHTTSSNIQTRLIECNQGTIIGLACERLGIAGSSEVQGQSSYFSLAKLF